MDFFDMAQRLQFLYGFRLILILCGNFYIAVGAGAVSLNRSLGLKLTCAKRGLCKVGVPKNSLKKYIQKLNELEYNYVVLDYNKDESKIVKRYENNGTKEIEYTFEIECETCQNKKEYSKSIYEKTLVNFTKKEFGEDFL